MSIVRRRPNKKSRRKNSEQNQPNLSARILIDDASVNGTVLSLTFDQAVRLDGTPQFLTNVDGPVPVSAVMTSPCHCEVTFDGDISAATSLILPFRDPAIRNSIGGYVVSNTFPVAA
jgi:hypothetical protein